MLRSWFTGSKPAEETKDTTDASSNVGTTQGTELSDDTGTFRPFPTSDATRNAARYVDDYSTKMNDR